jgi:hypothetical protein
LVEAVDIPGRATVGELAFLRACAGLAPRDGAYIELGCYQGRSTAAILDGTVCDLISIDDFSYAPPDLGPSSASVVAAHLGIRCDRWRCVFGDSASIPPKVEQVAFLFVDTEHTASRLTVEFDAWLPLTMPGAVIVLHDYSPRFPGIVAVTDRRLGHSDEWEMIGRENTMIAFRKADK